MRKVTLSRRELIALLEHNGFVARGRRSTSHVRYEGVVDGRTRFVDVDETIDEFAPKSHAVLYYIVNSQLGFSQHGMKAGWERFYAGEPRLARRAQLPYRNWS